MKPQPAPNFAYLAHHDARLVALATQADEHFAGDPTVTLFKLRQFGEVLEQRAAAKVGLFIGPDEAQQQLIDRLFERAVIGAMQRSLFHDLRAPDEPSDSLRLSRSCSDRDNTATTVELRPLEKAEGDVAAGVLTVRLSQDRLPSTPL